MIGNDWDEKLSIVWNSPGFHKFWHIIEHEYQTKTIYPTQNNIFNALKLTPYSNTKVVIVGQDPYHGENQAHGLSFSVQKGVTLPPSLKNIYKEIYDDLGIEEPNCGDLTKWAKEGVLLLNSSLTVIKDMPNSHKDIGWSNLTDYIIKVLNQKEETVVFILWGNFAKSKTQFITKTKQLILESTPPSPFSASSGFFGSHPFSKTNAFLDAHGLEPINWQL